MTKFNESLKLAVGIQSNINDLKKQSSAFRKQINAESFLQYAHLIQASAVSDKPIKSGSKQSKAIREMLENAGTSERDALTKVTVSFSAKVRKLISNAQYEHKTGAQGIVDILAEHELTTVSKLKRFVAGPIDKVQQLIEAIEKLEVGDRESLFAGCDGMGWLEEYK